MSGRRVTDDVPLRFRVIRERTRAERREIEREDEESAQRREPSGEEKS